MYFAIQGLVTFGPSERPIECSSITPSSSSRLGAFAEERVVEADADMLEHADRDDAVERSCHVAIVLQPEFDAGPTSLFSAARVRASASCSCDSVMPVTRAPASSAR